MSRNKKKLTRAEVDRLMEAPVTRLVGKIFFYHHELQASKPQAKADFERGMTKLKDAFFDFHAATDVSTTETVMVAYVQSMAQLVRERYSPRVASPYPAPKEDATNENV